MWFKRVLTWIARKAIHLLRNGHEAYPSLTFPTRGNIDTTTERDPRSGNVSGKQLERLELPSVRIEREQETCSVLV